MRVDDELLKLFLPFRKKKVITFCLCSIYLLFVNIDWSLVDNMQNGHVILFRTQHRKHRFNSVLDWKLPLKVHSTDDGNWQKVIKPVDSVWQWRFTTISTGLITKLIMQICKISFITCKMFRI